jgi:bacteriocin biosynthesis cyclodehydratase domain-containing protein
MNRPVLTPGLRVIRRSREELQVGLGRHVRLRVPDSEPVRRTLDTLRRGEAAADDQQTRKTLDLLAPVLVEGAGLVVGGVAPGDAAAAALHDPHGYRDRLAARSRARVAIWGDLAAPSADPRPLLRAAGLEVVTSVDSASVVLLLRSGEVDRGELDPLLRAGTPHLVVRLVEGTALLGPFVDPGRTACLCCIDAHLAVDDPEGPVLAARHARAASDRCDGIAEPIDNALAALAVAWTVRDIVTHVEGDRPSTWSSMVSLSATLATVTQTEWLRHPACGCTWLPDARPSSTMGA